MGILQKILSGGAGKLVKDVGGVLDNLTTTKEEKLAAQQKIKELISNHELELQKQVTNRWEADMKSDSWLSKNVRPLDIYPLLSMGIAYSPPRSFAFPATRADLRQKKSRTTNE